MIVTVRYFQSFLFRVYWGVSYISSRYIHRLPWWPASQDGALFASWRWGSKTLTWRRWSGSWWCRSIARQTGARRTTHLKPHRLRLKVGNRNTLTLKQLEGGLLSVSTYFPPLCFLNHLQLTHLLHYAVCHTSTLETHVTVFRTWLKQSSLSQKKKTNFIMICHSL